MKKLFAILPLFGSLGFFFGAYMFFIAGKASGSWSYFAAGLFVVCGLGFLIWGLGALFKKVDESVSYKEGQALKTAGTKITASIVHLQQITNIKINGRSPYVLHAKAVNPATGQEQIFKSFWLWSDPFTQARAGRGIDVYVDRNNAKKYYLDVESIGLPAEQTRTNKILIIMAAAIIGGILIVFIAGYFAQRAARNAKIPEFDSSVMKNFYDSTQNQTGTRMETENNLSAECMKQLYGEDVFVKMQAGKFVPPADMGIKLQECVKMETDQLTDINPNSMANQQTLNFPEEGRPDYFAVNMGGEITIDGALQLKFLEVLSDGRCPKGAQCAWAGQAKLKIAVNGKENIFTVDGLNRYPPTNELKANTGSSQTLGERTISLLDLWPYPETNKTIEKTEYRALFNVGK